MIRKYFRKIEKSLDNNSHIIEDYIINKQTFSDEKGTLDGEVFFTDESTLDFMEAINTKKEGKEKYSYHYMNKNKEMIFRYDNAKHHRDLSTFPNHKHTPEGVEPSNEPDMDNILSEIEKNVIKK